MIKNKHHLIPKSRRRDYKHKKVCDTSKTLKLWEDKHKNWHHLFGTMTIFEIIECLERVARIKGLKRS